MVRTAQEIQAFFKQLNAGGKFRLSLGIEMIGGVYLASDERGKRRIRLNPTILPGECKNSVIMTSE